MILTEDGTQAQNGQDTMLGGAKLHGQAVGSGGGGSGGGSGGGPVTPTNPNGSGASYTVSKTITNVYEDHSDNDSFTVVLGKAPTADVYMGITNPDTTEVLVSPTSVVFGTGNWSKKINSCSNCKNARR